MFKNKKTMLGAGLAATAVACAVFFLFPGAESEQDNPGKEILETGGESYETPTEQEHMEPKIQEDLEEDSDILKTPKIKESMESQSIEDPEVTSSSAETATPKSSPDALSFDDVTTVDLGVAPEIEIEEKQKVAGWHVTAHGHQLSAMPLSPARMYLSTGINVPKIALRRRRCVRRVQGHKRNLGGVDCRGHRYPGSSAPCALALGRRR